MLKFSGKEVGLRSIRKAVVSHLGNWVVVNAFNLKKYYTIKTPDSGMESLIDQCANEILAFPFMKNVRIKYYCKGCIFQIKKIFGLLK
jgi:hypothetical protein